ncbi:MAG TPA: Na+/H+ antiporter NhaA [Burkholderiaceae bacterium]|nr:Na+/H+ antiporter NhaA [Burkholderiaceae bacterium]
MARAQYPLEPLFGRILSPFERFLRRTTAGGIVLVGATVVALSLASIFGAETIHAIASRSLTFSAGPFSLELSLHQAVNEGLMVLFFLMVGLELKREILVGELSSLRDAALPVVAAGGGMLVPALVFIYLNHGGAGAAGWGVPMATDIAFAVGILVLLAWRTPKNLIVFLMALAIADDLGAVLVIALFYSEQIQVRSLVAAGVIFVALLVLNRGGIRHPFPYAIAGVLLWLAVLESGVHATLAGILLAMVIPARSSRTPEQFERRLEELLAAFRADRRDEHTADDPLSNHRMTAVAEEMEHSAADVQSPLQRIEHRLTPWVTFVIIPVFALSNAGIDLFEVSWGDAFADHVTLGVAAGLALGKFVGVSLFSWIAVVLGIARLPSGVAWKHLLGAAWLAGIGFTMSLFIARLAFSDLLLVERATLGILAGSALSAVVGLIWLYRAGSGVERAAAPRATGHTA